jgi:V8-like Glu-specific endopeptidase
MIDTAGGQSGSAIYYNNGGNPVIIGVHTNGPSYNNYGTRLIGDYANACDKIIKMYRKSTRLKTKLDKFN